MAPLDPVIEPYDRGLLDIGAGNHMYWEQCGNPEGKPVLTVHGGPGSGCSVDGRRRFNPETYRSILFDQRNCGRSTPHASDPTVDLATNTTDNLIADMEQLREHLGIDRWMLYGGSWGSTLILAYAQRHPERVTEAVIAAVTTTRRSEIAWLYQGVGRFFPEQWQRFHDFVAAEERGDDVFDLLAAYGRLLGHPDPTVRELAANEWLRWEDTVISMDPQGKHNAYSDRPDDAKLAFVRICAHYFSNGAFLEEGQLLRNAGKLAGIPAVLIHGRFDLGGPLLTAWELSRAWPGAELVVVEDSGHTGSPSMRGALRTVIDHFAGT
ncbi:proline iminopeptidase [Phycicoccus badiiscoriae]|uniref:Proline iminopeptidase n=1 Tax=Pedococcus badiiscoriae TaxID=642776 RepID=A0A852WIF6_9MICO|nr:prolyl aminopeptidase [Pedococcus badiiscoriae]NYG08670.1 proline iminopeptidase [Pedococcus badiiscoriae]